MVNIIFLQVLLLCGLRVMEASASVDPLQLHSTQDPIGRKPGRSLIGQPKEGSRSKRNSSDRQASKQKAASAGICPPEDQVSPKPQPGSASRLVSGCREPLLPPTSQGSWKGRRKLSCPRQAGVEPLSGQGGALKTDGFISGLIAPSTLWEGREPLF